MSNSRAVTGGASCARAAGRAALALLAATAATSAPTQTVGTANSLLYKGLGSPEGWTIGGYFRARGEVLDNQFRPALNRSDAALMLQTAVFAQYQTGGLRLGGELMDARSYFQKRITSVGTTEVDAVELIQGYAAYDFGKVLGGTSAVLTAGRQTINDGSRRLIARQLYRNSVNSFTGLRFDWQDKNRNQLRLFWLMPHIRLGFNAEGIRHNAVEWDHEGTDLQFWGGSFTMGQALGGSFQFYGYKLDEHDTPRFATRDRHIATTGMRLFRAPKPDRWDWDVEAAYQFGHALGSVARSERAEQTVSAYFLHAEAGHTFPGAWAPRVAIRYDLASGDTRDRTTYKRFDTLFGARRFDYGPTGLYGPIQRANLDAVALQLEAAPSKRTDALIAWRPSWLQNRYDSFGATSVRDATGRSGRFAGHQIEGRVRTWLVPKLLRLDTGAAVLVKGRFLRDAPNAPDTGNTLFGYSAAELFF